MLPTVVIAGRPNVGKSTIFNRLVGRRQAIVSDTPGVTRDRKEGEALLRGRRVRLIDTAGLEEAPPDSLAGRMRGSSEAAVAQADLVVFVVDARTGTTPADQHFAAWLRRQGWLAGGGRPFGLAPLPELHLQLTPAGHVVLQAERARLIALAAL